MLLIAITLFCISGSLECMPSAVVIHVYTLWGCENAHVEECDLVTSRLVRMGGEGLGTGNCSSCYF